MNLSKTYISILFALLIMGMVACSGEKSGAVSSNAFTVSGTVTGCAEDSIKVFYLNGLSLTPLLSAPLNKGGESPSFTLSGTLPAPGFYWIGTQPQTAKSVILGGESNVQLNGDCKTLARSGVLTGSQINDDMQTMSTRFGAMQNEFNQSVQILNSSPAGSRPEVSAKVKEIYAKQKAIVDSLNKAQPILGNVFVLNLFEPFDPSNNPKNYPNSLEHFAGEYFSEANLSDPAYNYLPILSDYSRGYAQNIFQGGQIPQEKAEMYWNKFLDRLPKGSLARQNIMAKGLMVLESLKSPSYKTFGNQYISEFPNDPNAPRLRQVMTQMEGEIERQKTIEAQFAIGSTPPNITLPNPDGKTIKLSDLKGKVVMIDFWASWCGPCRRENPSVVKLYDQYKNSGFEILGVSLDKDKAKWLQAIEKDNLTWKHVSDLQFWQSKAARDYKVSSIPATFLIDREGKILAKGLRGKALENKLAEIFASN